MHLFKFKGVSKLQSFEAGMFSSIKTYNHRFKAYNRRIKSYNHRIKNAHSNIILMSIALRTIRIIVKTYSWTGK